jgi:hypothetical protein
MQENSERGRAINGEIATPTAGGPVKEAGGRASQDKEWE